MSILTDSLNQIKTWLETNFPLAAESITPGLTLSEIQSKIETLPFSLANEVYELYQWSRGHSLDTQTIYTDIFEPYEGMSLCNLESGIEVFPRFEHENEICAVNYIGKPLFPVFKTDGSYLCVVGDWEDKQSSPIIFVSDVKEITHKYISLTSMILTYAECCETDAIYFDKDGFPRWNNQKYASIYLKHNSNILEFSIKRLEQELTGTSNCILKDRGEKNFLGDIDYLDRQRQNLSSRQLDYQVIKPLINAMQDDKYGNTRIRKIRVPILPTYIIFSLIIIYLLVNGGSFSKILILIARLTYPQFRNIKKSEQ